LTALQCPRLIRGDVLNPDTRFAVSPSLLTDGVCLWRADLQYYVATYHVELPDEFVAHWRQNGWSVPALNEAEQSRLGRQLYRDMGGQEAGPSAEPDRGGM
jgi:hypothetical protein